MGAGTGFDIGECDLNYYIYSNGTYRCTFTLMIVGNDQSSSGNSPGIFLATGNISNVAMVFEQTSIDSQISLVGTNQTQIRFLITSVLQPGNQYDLTGSYSGNYTSNTTSGLSFAFGINWGTRAGIQRTKIFLERGTVLLEISPSPHRTFIVSGILQFEWTDVSKQEFISETKITTDITIPLLSVNVNNWVITGSSSKLNVTFHSRAPFTLHCYLILPSWISTDVEDFEVKAQSNKSLTFVVEEFPPTGTKGIIEIRTVELLTTIAIEVEYTKSNPINHFIIGIILGLIGAGIFFGSFMIYQNKEKIIVSMKSIKDALSRQKRVTVTDKVPINDHSEIINATSILKRNRHKEEITFTSFNEVREKWSPFLKERELNVLNILFNGEKNQQEIANELGLSKSTMSRIIVKLEQKRLVTRVKRGMSNIVKIESKNL